MVDNASSIKTKDRPFYVPVCQTKIINYNNNNNNNGGRDYTEKFRKEMIVSFKF